MDAWSGKPLMGFATGLGVGMGMAIAGCARLNLTRALRHEETRPFEPVVSFELHMGNDRSIERH